MKSGVETAELLGRYTIYEKKTQTVILDGAHNPSAIRALIKSLKSDYPDQQPSIIIGLKKDKDAKSLLSLVSDYSKDLYYCDFDTDFALSLSDAQAQCSVPLKSYTLGTDFPKSKLIVITGSLYFIPHFVQQLQ